MDDDPAGGMSIDYKKRIGIRNVKTMLLFPLEASGRCFQNC